MPFYGRRCATRVRNTIATFALTLVGCSHLPVPGDIKIGDIHYELGEMRFPSGLHVLVESDPNAELVRIATVIGVGSAGDPVGKSGMAHLVEHLNFRSQPTGESRVDDLLLAAGADYNASTNFDHTVYKTSVPAEKLGAALGIEAARLISPLAGLSNVDVRRELEVVRSELHERSESRYLGVAVSKMQEMVFPQEHPYHRAVAGTDDSLDSIQLNDIADFAKRHYRPDNATIVISGPIDLKNADQLIQASLPKSLLFADEPGAVQRKAANLQALVERPPNSNYSKNGSIEEISAPVGTPEIWVAWRVPGGYASDSLALTHMAAEVDAMLNSGTQRDDHVSGASHVLLTGVRESLLIAKVTLYEEKDVAKTAEHLLNQLYHLWEPSFKAGYLITPRQQRRSTVALAEALSDPLARTIELARRYHVRDQVVSLGELREEVGSLPTLDFAGFAQRYLQRKQAHVLLVRPFGEGRAPMRRTDIAVLEALPESAEVQVQLPSREEMRAYADKLKLPQPSEVRLENGLRVFLIPHEGAALSHAALQFAGGIAAGKTPSVASMGNAFVSRGQDRFGYATSHFGGYSGPFTDIDAAGYFATMGAGNTGNMVAILAEQVRTRKYRRSLLGDLRRSSYWRISSQAPRSPTTLALDNFYRALYDGHAYGWAFADSDQLDFSSEDLRAWEAATHQPKNGVLVISGGFDPAQTEALVTKHFGRWKSPNAAKWWPRTLRTSTDFPKLLTFALPGRTQTRVSIGCAVALNSDHEAAGLDVLSERWRAGLNQRLRRTLGAVYSVSGSFTPRSGSIGELKISFWVDDAALHQVTVAVADMITRAPDDEPGELLAARWSQLIEYGTYAQDPEVQANRLASAISRGWSLNEAIAYPRTLIDVSDEQVRQVATSCRERLVVELAGDPEVLGEPGEQLRRELHTH